MGTPPLYFNRHSLTKISVQVLFQWNHLKSIPNQNVRFPNCRDNRVKGAKKIKNAVLSGSCPGALQEISLVRLASDQVVRVRALARDRCVVSLGRHYSYSASLHPGV